MPGHLAKLAATGHLVKKANGHLSLGGTCGYVPDCCTVCGCCYSRQKDLLDPNGSKARVTIALDAASKPAGWPAYLDDWWNAYVAGIALTSDPMQPYGCGGWGRDIANGGPVSAGISCPAGSKMWEATHSEGTSWYIEKTGMTGGTCCGVVYSGGLTLFHDNSNWPGVTGTITVEILDNLCCKNTEGNCQPAAESSCPGDGTTDCPEGVAVRSGGCSGCGGVSGVTLAANPAAMEAFLANG